MLSMEVVVGPTVTVEKPKVTTIQIPRPLWKRLKLLAAEEETSVGAVVERAVQEYERARKARQARSS